MVDRVEWAVMTVWRPLNIGLFEGCEDLGIMGSVYDKLPGSDLYHFSNDRLGSYIYDPHTRKFWRHKIYPRSELHSKAFGVSREGLVVSGEHAYDTTIESYYHLCERAPYGARKRVREFFGRSGK